MYFDTNVVIFHLGGAEPFRTALADLFRAVDQGVVAAVTSELTLAEVLVRPIRAGDAAKRAACEELLADRVHFRVHPVTRDVLVSAATLRAQTPLKLPDAIHAATALVSGCDSLLTNDEGFRAVVGPEVVILSAVI